MQTTEKTENREIKGIIFDMDNTLFDFIKAKLAACNAMVDFIGAGDPDEIFQYFLRKDHGFEDLENIEDYLKDNNLHSNDLYHNCCNIYEDIKLQTIEPYPGVDETFGILKETGLTLGVVTDAHTKNATLRLKKIGLFDTFDALITTDMTGTKKPAPEIFYYALDTLNLIPEQTIYVGDSLRRDIEPAQKIGMITAYAAYGDRNYNENRTWQPDHLLNRISDVIELI